MKKWIVIALLAGLTLVSCHKTIIVEDVGQELYMAYTNDLKVDCVISWKDFFNVEEASIRELLPGEAYIQHRNTNAPGIWDEKGECSLLGSGRDVRITFGDGTCFSLDQTGDFWLTLPQYRRTVKYRKDGTIREIKYEFFLSDIHALAVKP